MSEAKPRYKRILLKLSGEALAGEQGYGIDPAVLERLAQEIRTIHDLEVGTAIVIGGGNIFRGLHASANGMDRASADYMISSPLLSSAYERQHPEYEAYRNRMVRVGDAANDALPAVTSSA